MPYPLHRQPGSGLELRAFLDHLTVPFNRPSLLLHAVVLHLPPLRSATISPLTFSIDRVVESNALSKPLSSPSLSWLVGACRSTQIPQDARRYRTRRRDSPAPRTRILLWMPKTSCARVDSQLTLVSISQCGPLHSCLCCGLGHQLCSELDTHSLPHLRWWSSPVHIIYAVFPHGSERKRSRG